MLHVTNMKRRAQKSRETLPAGTRQLNSLTPRQLESLVPLASAWVAEQEQYILDMGIPLTLQQLADAKRIRVVHPSRVRLLRVPQIPAPTHPALAAAAGASNLISAATAGLTARYGIFIRSDCWGNRAMVVHELVHTMQYERLGGIAEFLRPYLLECLNPPGYPHGPLEREAIVLTRKICPA